MTEANSRNSEQQAYYQTMADFIGIFGLFYQRTIEQRDRSFILGSFEPYDTLHSDANLYYGTPMIVRYAEAAADGLIQGLADFRTLLSEPSSEINPRYAAFTSSYVQDLMRRTHDQIPSGSLLRVGSRTDPINSILHGAFRNATRVTTQLAAIFGEDFNPQYPVLLSRIHMDQLVNMRKMIGIPSSFLREDEYGANFDLLHPTEGLDRKKLRILGRGVAKGCPASMLVSKETAQYIEDEIGVFNGKEVMLKRYARDLAADFRERVIEPFFECEPEEVDTRYTLQTRALLRGEIWHSVLSSAK